MFPGLSNQVLQDFFARARQCLQPSKPSFVDLSRAVGREAECERVWSYCNGCLESGQSGSLYISGCPGSGKTMLVNEILDKLLSSAQVSTMLRFLFLIIAHLHETPSRKADDHMFSLSRASTSLMCVLTACPWPIRTPSSTK